MFYKTTKLKATLKRAFITDYLTRQKSFSANGALRAQVFVILPLLPAATSQQSTTILVVKRSYTLSFGAAILALCGILELPV